MFNFSVVGIVIEPVLPFSRPLSTRLVFLLCHLNTSYVKVQLNMKKAYEKSLQNLNTSYVKVQFIVYLMNWSSL